MGQAAPGSPNPLLPEQYKRNGWTFFLSVGHLTWFGEVVRRADQDVEIRFSTTPATMKTSKKQLLIPSTIAVT